jgi:hypothetical protein
MKGGGLSGDLYRFVRVSGRLARFERNRENSIYPLIFRVFLHWGHVAEWLRSGLQNRLHQFNSGRGLQSNPLRNQETVLFSRAGEGRLLPDLLPLVFERWGISALMAYPDRLRCLASLG